MENSTRAERRGRDATRGTDDDTLYEVLGDRRRRSVLACLYEHDAPVALTDLADAVAAREVETGGDGVTPADVERVFITLYHVHIPKMDEAGVVEYDHDRKTVRLSENADRLRSVHDLVDA